MTPVFVSSSISLVAIICLDWRQYTSDAHNNILLSTSKLAGYLFFEPIHGDPRRGRQTSEEIHNGRQNNINNLEIKTEKKAACINCSKTLQSKQSLRIVVACNANWLKINNYTYKRSYFKRKFSWSAKLKCDICLRIPLEWMILSHFNGFADAFRMRTILHFIVRHFPCSKTWKNSRLNRDEISPTRFTYNSCEVSQVGSVFGVELMQLSNIISDNLAARIGFASDRECIQLHIFADVISRGPEGGNTTLRFHSSLIFSSTDHQCIFPTDFYWLE